MILLSKKGKSLDRVIESITWAMAITVMTILYLPYNLS